MNLNGHEENDITEALRLVHWGAAQLRGGGQLENTPRSELFFCGRAGACEVGVSQSVGMLVGECVGAPFGLRSMRAGTPLSHLTTYWITRLRCEA